MKKPVVIPKTNLISMRSKGNKMWMWICGVFASLGSIIVLLCIIGTLVDIASSDSSAKGIGTIINALILFVITPVTAVFVLITAVLVINLKWPADIEKQSVKNIEAYRHKTKIFGVGGLLLALFLLFIFTAILMTDDLLLSVLNLSILPSTVVVLAWACVMLLRSKRAEKLLLASAK